MNAWWYGGENFGDITTPLLIERLTGAAPVRSRGQGALFAVGSILHKLTPGALVWGTGAADAGHVPKPFPKGAKVFAVRGPKTRAAVLAAGGQCPEIYGDPALLLPFLVPRIVGPSRDVGAVIHYADRAHVALHEGVLHIDPCQPVLAVLKQIWSCKRIVSSSLHGLIVAEAYGIPSAWLQVDEGAHLVGRSFKFKDYGLSTGRDLAPLPMRSGETMPVPREWLPPPTGLSLRALLRAFPLAILPAILRRAQVLP